MEESDYEMEVEGSEYESDDAEDEDDFVESAPVRQVSAAYNVLDAADCQALANEEVTHVRELLDCSFDVAAVLLRQFRWDRERLTSAYLEDSEKVLLRAGFHRGQSMEIIHDGSGTVLIGGTQQPASSLEEIKCLICYEQKAAYSALACGHKFCNECYVTFLSHKIKDEGHACIFTTCPHDKCLVLVTERLAKSLPLSQEQQLQFERACSLERSYVDDNPTLKWCTGVDCGLAVRARKGTRGVQCKCGKRFCFACNQDDHAPCSCEELQKWIVKCKDDSETYNWLVSNTKPCPKCGTSIEKNGGCNHMTCKNGACKYEFCWVCVGPWKDHSGSYYSCNRYDPEQEKESAEGKKKDSSRAALERYLHYYTRFTNHHNSLKFETQAKLDMEKKIQEMEQIGDNTWMDCQYLNDANEALYECRYALQYTYVYAYYLPATGNYRAHFEMQQKNLEQQTEELAGKLEDNVKEMHRMDIVQCYQMARKRLKNLFEIVEDHEQEEKGQGSSDA